MTAKFKTEYPIIFKDYLADLVRKGIKTETRRARNFKYGHYWEASPSEEQGYWDITYQYPAFDSYGMTREVGEGTNSYRSPYGLVGGRLYVRQDYSLKKEQCDLWLKLTDISIEALGDITEEGALAEGFEDRQSFLDTFFHIGKIKEEDQLEALIQPVWVAKFEKVNK